MKRRAFTLAGFFGAIGATLGKALGYDGAPKPETVIGFDPAVPGKDTTVYTIKVGRKLMTLPGGPLGVGGWDVYADSEKTAASMNEGIAVKNRIDQNQWLLWKDKIPLRPLALQAPLAVPPINVVRWNASPQVFRPEISGPTFATIDDLRELRDALWSTQGKPEDIMRDTVRELARRVTTAINARERFCNGHNGPALLACEPLRDMPDGRRLCPYCYKQETENGVQHDARARGQAPSV